MVRKQILISEELDRTIAEKSRARGISQGELVRMTLLDGLLGESSRRSEAWDFVLQSMDQALHRGTTSVCEPAESADRGWTRDDLYD